MRGTSYTGQTLAGRYAIGERLGEGAWGAVYAAVQTDLGRKVAVKILHTNIALEQEGIARFQREARAAAALGHPNIAQVTDFQSNPNEPPFLVMELLAGETLGSVLQRENRLPSARVAAIAHQILSGLDTAHRAGIVHRDVKPDNVFLVSMPGINDFVKLLDFGIAKLSAEGQAQITDAGAMIGSPAFMAPEQVRNAGIDHRTDLYAVGATMYVALTGKFPFDVTSMHALLFAITETKPAPVSAHDPTIDARLVAIIDRALQKDPASRFFSATEMRAALEPLLAATSRPGMANTFPSGQGAGQNMTSVLSASAAPPTVANASSPQPSRGPMQSSPYGAPISGAPMTANVSSAPHTPAVMSPPMGTPPPGPPPMAMHAPAASPPANKGSGGVVIGLLVAILVVLLLLGGGVTIFFVTRESEPKTASVAPGSASVMRADAPPSAAVATGVAPAGATSVAATAGTTTSGAQIKPKPGPTTTIDAGAAPTPVRVDAGAPLAKKQYAGSVARYSGGQFNNYDIAKTREAFEKVNPQINVCYAATEFEPPDHQFTQWICTVDPAGNVTSARRATSHDPHPKLDACVIAALRQMKVQALPGGGTFQIGFSSRTRDNP